MDGDVGVIEITLRQMPLRNQAQKGNGKTRGQAVPEARNDVQFQPSDLLYASAVRSLPRSEGSDILIFIIHPAP